MKFYEFKQELNSYENFDVHREKRLDYDTYQSISVTIITYNKHNMLMIDDSQKDSITLMSTLGTPIYKGIFFKALQLAIKYANTEIIDRDLKDAKIEG